MKPSKTEDRSPNLEHRTQTQMAPTQITHHASRITHQALSSYKSRVLYEIPTRIFRITEIDLAPIPERQWRIEQC